MDLTTIEMPKEEAQAKFEEYRASVKLRHDREDEMIMRGYRALAKGQQIIDLTATIRAGGGMRIPSRWHRGSDAWVPRLAYVVLAVWNLTELERTVLAGRFRE